MTRSKAEEFADKQWRKLAPSMRDTLYGLARIRNEETAKTIKKQIELGCGDYNYCASCDIVHANFTLFLGDDILGEIQVHRDSRLTFDTREDDGE